MNPEDFIEEVLQLADNSELINSTNLDVEKPIVRIRLNMEGERLIDIFRNFETGTISYTLIESDERIYSIDYDSIRGWHYHPIENPETHEECGSKKFSEFIEKVEENIDKR